MRVKVLSSEQLKELADKCKDSKYINLVKAIQENWHKLKLKDLKKYNLDEARREDFVFQHSRLNCSLIVLLKCHIKYAGSKCDIRNYKAFRTMYKVKVLKEIIEMKNFVLMLKGNIQDIGKLEAEYLVTESRG